MDRPRSPVVHELYYSREAQRLIYSQMIEKHSAVSVFQQSSGTYLHILGTQDHGNGVHIANGSFVSAAIYKFIGRLLQMDLSSFIANI